MRIADRVLESSRVSRVFSVRWGGESKSEAVLFVSLAFLLEETARKILPEAVLTCCGLFHNLPHYKVWVATFIWGVGTTSGARAMLFATAILTLRVCA